MLNRWRSDYPLFTDEEEAGFFCGWYMALSVIVMMSKLQAWIPGTGSCSEVVGTAPWHAEPEQIGL